MFGVGNTAEEFASFLDHIRFNAEFDLKIMTHYYKYLVHWTELDQEKYPFIVFRLECDILLMRGVVNLLRSLTIDISPQRNTHSEDSFDNKMRAFQKMILQNKLNRLASVVEIWQYENMFVQIYHK